MVKGKVRNLTNYGAFIEIEEGIDGLLHVSDMSWTRKISHPSEVVEKGEEVECEVLSVDQERRRIALGLKQTGRGSVGDRHPEPLPAGPARQGQGHEDHQLRRLRRPGRRPGRPAAHLGAGRPQGRESRRRGQGRRRDRSEDPARRHRRAQDRPVAQARRVGRGRRSGGRSRWQRQSAGGVARAGRRNSRAASARDSGPLFKSASELPKRTNRANRTIVRRESAPIDSDRTLHNLEASSRASRVTTARGRFFLASSRNAAHIRSTRPRSARNVQAQRASRIVDRASTATSR